MSSLMTIDVEIPPTAHGMLTCAARLIRMTAQTIHLADPEELAEAMEEAFLALDELQQLVVPLLGGATND